MLDSIRSSATSGISKVRENPLLKEFKEFALRGNVLDLAVGIMVGGAFNTIVSSLVNDIIMPPLGLLIGKVDFANLFINLSGKNFMSLAQAKAAGAATVNYGVFINNVINFLIMAFVIFLIVRTVNRMKKANPLPQKRLCSFCCSPIADAAKRCPHCTSTL